MKTHQPTTLLDGIVFGEGPRWRNGKLWFSDMHGEAVKTVDLQGRCETICTLETRPSGLGWDPEGRLLVVSMADRKLLRWDGNHFHTVADLAPLAVDNANDMVVARDGRAYVGNFGFDLFQDEPPKPTVLILVEPDGDIRVAADDLMFPNGTILSADEKILIVAETFASRLTEFDVQADGTLAGRRVFAELGQRQPDGICLDAEGAVWVSCFGQDEFIRVRRGGEILERVPTPGRRAVACVLGGDDRKTLFLCTAETTIEDLREGRSKGRIETVKVEVPGAGTP